MASKDPEEPFNTETDEETIALRKKRSRRVSFADREITSVYIFNRDEDYEQESSPVEPSYAEHDNEVLGFFRDLAADSDDSKEMSPEDGDDDEEIASRKSFLRPMESPSPGSSIIGSATANDEDNFFGPVSAGFIRPGRLSDSAASDDNHDITMDSTAFSMHFRSLVRSESGDMKTPTGSRFTFQEKTPSQVGTPSDPGSFMVLTKAKKHISESSPPTVKVSGSRDSNEMSLVGDNSHRYDYRRLSPTLEALLAEGSEDMHAVPVFDSAFEAKSLKKNEVSIFSENRSGMMGTKDTRDTDMCNIGPDDISQEGVSVLHFNLGELNGGSRSTLMDPITHDSLSYVNDDRTADAPIDHLIQTPSQLNKVNMEVVETGTVTKNVEFPNINSATTPDVNTNSNACRLGLLIQLEPLDSCSAQGSLKVNSSRAGPENSHIDHPTDQQPESPLAGSITMLSAKQKQIFLDTTDSSRRSLYVTPSPNQSGSLLRKENIKLGESVSSLKKSISRFKIIGSSPHTSTHNNGLEKSEQRGSKYPSSTSPFHIVVEERSRSLQHQHVDAPIMNLEKHLLSADRKNGEHKSTINMDSDGSRTLKKFVSLKQNGETMVFGKYGESLDHQSNLISHEDGSRTPKNFGSLNQNVETMVYAKDGEPPDHRSNLISHEDKPTKMMTAMPSHSQMTSSGRKVTHNIFMSNNAMKGVSDITGSDSSLLEITLDCGKDQKATNDSNKNVSPPVERLEQKLSPAENQGSLSGDLKQQIQHKEFVDIGSGSDGNSIEYASTGGHLTPIADKLDTLFVDRIAHSSSALRETNHIKDFTQVKREDDRKILLSDLQNVSETIRNMQTPSRDTVLKKFQLGSPDKSCQIANDTIQTKEGLPRERMKDSAVVPASPHIERGLNEPSFLKSSTWKEPTQSPSWKELGNPLLRESMHILFGKDGLSSKSISDEHGKVDCCQGLDNSQNQFQLQDFENSSGRKRRSEEIVLGDTDDVFKTNQMQRSPKVQKSSKGSEKIGLDTILKHWTDILHKFSIETSQILSPLINTLNLRAIAMLEDFLVHLQKVNKYGTICSEILSQKTNDQSSNIRYNRIAETRLLLHRIAYEKAKLQIMHAKHEKLLKSVELLSSGMQKFHILKLNYARHLPAPGGRDAQVNDKLHYSSSANLEDNHEVVADKVATRRQEVEALDQKIKNVVKSLNTHCKMKGELSFADTIVLLNDHLKKRACCRYICQDLQLWEIDDLERTHGHYKLVLNYHGFICQRFTLIADPVSSMAISNKVNDINIKQNFPNMDACTAFAFVFNCESTKKTVGSKSLAKETQKTSSLLCNLLSVVEEVQLARIQIRNLSETTFNSPSVGQLDLHLSFIDFNSGAKVTMTLDVTCLNRGFYPSEILPYQLLVPSTRMQNSPPESLSAEINAAIGNLSNGYSRIIRLCRRVSEVMQSSKN